MAFEQLPPEKQDHVITDPDEQQLVSFQITQKLMREKMQNGLLSPVSQKILEVVNTTVDLMQQIVDEREPDKKNELRKKLRVFQNDSWELKRQWLMDNED
jgi:hypothetical protein